MTSRQRALASASLAVLSQLVVASAEAGMCPPESRLDKPRELTAPPDEGTSRTVLSVVNLENWHGVHGLVLRMRRLDVAPGGFVPLHWHNDRPSIVYVVSGEIIEHQTFCSVPIVHKTGEWTPEFGDFMGHWWENKSGAPVVLISTDLVPTEDAQF